MRTEDLYSPRLKVTNFPNFGTLLGRWVRKPGMFKENRRTTIDGLSFTCVRHVGASKDERFISPSPQGPHFAVLFVTTQQPEGPDEFQIVTMFNSRRGVNQLKTKHQKRLRNDALPPTPAPAEHGSLRLKTCAARVLVQGERSGRQTRSFLCDLLWMR